MDDTEFRREIQPLLTALEAWHNQPVKVEYSSKYPILKETQEDQRLSMEYSLFLDKLARRA